MTEQDLQRLVDSMSLQEKADQLLQLPLDFYQHLEHEVTTGPATQMGLSDENLSCAGSVLNGTGAAALRQFQDRYMASQPHHIPMMFMMDVIHGFRTIFPAPIAQGASFDPDLIRECASVSAAESAAAGVHAVFSPMTDLARDARWGRVMESTGEDPYLNGRMCRAMVEGYQGNDMKESGKVCACVKHFAGYGAAEAGREYNTAQITDNSLFNYYLPSYEEGIRAGAGMVMTSFNTINDIPATTNQWLMRDVLREKMGFDGVLISDYSAIHETVNHGHSADDADAAAKALTAGVDIDMVTSCYTAHLADLIKEGVIGEALLNESVMRVLRLKNKLGLFENPYKDADPEKEKELILCEKHRELARTAARRSCVLLKNNGILPLKSSQKTAFIGPYIDNNEMISSWAITGKTQDCVTIKDAALQAMDADQISFRHGTSIMPRGYQFKGFREPDHSETFYADVFTDPEKAMNDAVSAAAAADVVILCLGEHYLQTGEATSRSDISLSENQLALYRRIREVNPHIAVVLFNGRPLDLREISESAEAILEAWLPGTEGGHAIIDLLTGIESPSGKLPISFPWCVGQIPVYYNHFATGRMGGADGNPDAHERFSSKYVDIPNEPLYCFGHGLTYAAFTCSDVALSSSELRADTSITASVTLRNTSGVTATQTMQLYIRDLAASVVRPVKELKDFKKITLAPGNETTVSFTVTEEMLRFHRADGTWGSEPGRFSLWIGDSSQTKNKADFVLQ